MKNLLVNVFKTLFFFDLAVIVISLLPTLKIKNPAYSLLASEALVFGVVLIFTLFFLRFVEKRKLHIYSKKGKFKSALWGVIIGIALMAAILGILWLLGAFKITGFNKVSLWYIYIAALLLNVAAGELLIRGYLFSLYKKYHGFIFAAVFSTALYLCVNTEIFSKSKLYIASAILFNLLLCCFTDTAKGPLNIVLRFVYTIVSGLMLGGDLLTEKYPVLAKYSFSGNKLISGGKYQVEGSVITVAILAILTLFMLNRKYNLLQYLRKDNLKRYTLEIKDFFTGVGRGIKRSMRIK